MREINPLKDLKPLENPTKRSKDFTLPWTLPNSTWPTWLGRGWKIADFFSFRKLYKKSNSMVFDFKKIMDFAMDIDNLNLANLWGRWLTQSWSTRFFCQSVPNKRWKMKARDLQKISKPFLYIKSRNLSKKHILRQTLENLPKPSLTGPYHQAIQCQNVKTSMKILI